VHSRDLLRLNPSGLGRQDSQSAESSTATHRVASG